VDASSLLYEAWQKLGRGEEHLDALDRDIQAFLDSKPHTVSREFDREKSQYLFRLNLPPHDPDSRWSLMIGDCIHCCRSALDYLAWRLAGSDLNDRQTQFPIFLTEGGFEDRGLKRVERIASGAVAEIRKLQPFARTNPTRSRLWVLHELDARDKHKLLTTTRALTKQFGITGTQPYPVTIPTEGFTVFGPKPDTVFAVVSAPPNQDVEVESDFAFDIAFEESVIPSDGVYLVRPALREITKEVEGVLGYFMHLIQSNPDWIPKS
jgi:hypothetical protein